MKALIKSNWKYILFLAICGLVGGYFTGIYTVQSLSSELLNEALAEIGSVEVLYIVTAIQGLGYAVILGLIGKILAKKIGIWKKIEFSKKAIIDILFVLENISDILFDSDISFSVVDPNYIFHFIISVQPKASGKMQAQNFYFSIV